MQLHKQVVSAAQNWHSFTEMKSKDKPITYQYGGKQQLRHCIYMVTVLVIATEPSSYNIACPSSKSDGAQHRYEAGVYSPRECNDT